LVVVVLAVFMLALNFRAVVVAHLLMQTTLQSRPVALTK
jgi:hypothetical protein